MFYQWIIDYDQVWAECNKPSSESASYDYYDFTVGSFYD